MDNNRVSLLLQNIVGKIPELKEYLSPLSLQYLHDKPAVKEAGDYSSIRDRLSSAIFEIVGGFLTSNQQAGTAARAMSAALSQAYIEAADVAYQDGGGTLPLDEDTASLARGLLDAQFGYVDALFETLKGLRKEGDFSAQDEAERRAEGYCQSLDGMYGQVRVMAAGNKMLTFDGTDGDANHICQSINGTCVRLKGERHRASWWIAHDLIPYPGNKNYDCGAWRCQHYLVDDEGNRYTL